MGLNGVKWGGIGRNGGFIGIYGDGKDRYFIFRGMPETVR